MIILMPCDYYLPGFKAGGALRSLSNVVEQLGDEFRFKVVTRDHDLGDKEPYKEIAREKWQPVGKADVFYLSPGKLSLQRWRRLMSGTQHDVLYLNRFFFLLISPSNRFCCGVWEACRKNPSFWRQEENFLPAPLELNARKSIFIF